MNYLDQERISEEQQNQQPALAQAPAPANQLSRGQQEDQQLLGNRSEGTFPSSYSVPHAPDQQGAISMSSAGPVLHPHDFHHHHQGQHQHPTYPHQYAQPAAPGYPPQQQPSALQPPHYPPPNQYAAAGPASGRHQGFPVPSANPSIRAQSYDQPRQQQPMLYPQQFMQQAAQAEAPLQAAPQQAPQQMPQQFMQQAAQAEAPLQAAPQQAPQQMPPVYTRVSRNPNERPIVKLSISLIDTYKRINDEYYRDPSNVPRPTRRPEPGSRGGARNNGWDDENYDYIIRRGELLGNRYKIEERIGRGSFGQVVKAVDTVKKVHVAIKIIKSKKPFLAQAGTEIDILTHLNQRDPQDQNNIVRLLNTFMHRNHQCLVFEMLSLNLYELLKNTQFEGVSLNLIRKFAKQILKALHFLSLDDVDVIHCDLKPENILLRHPKRSGVKVIDFGSSCRSNNQMYSYIQSRFYRSPEVLLGLPYSVAIDMWSLGCILVEMHTGEPLFSGQDQIDQMQKIVKILGMIPNEMIESMEEGKRNDYHLDRTPDNNWFLGLKADQTERIVPSANPRASLEGIIRRREPAEQQDIQYDAFIDLIHKMLQYRPEQRIDPGVALHHPFISTG